jgi:hypothetical protein
MCQIVGTPQPLSLCTLYITLFFPSWPKRGGRGKEGVLLREEGKVKEEWEMNREAGKKEEEKREDDFGKWKGKRGKGNRKWGKRKKKTGKRRGREIREKEKEKRGKGKWKGVRAK